jgi:hypothetical protein
MIQAHSDAGRGQTGLYQRGNASRECETPKNAQIGSSPGRNAAG